MIRDTDFKWQNNNSWLSQIKKTWSTCIQWKYWSPTCWALSFDQFNFTRSFCPGIKNDKAKALSQVACRLLMGRVTVPGTGDFVVPWEPARPIQVHVEQVVCPRNLEIKIYSLVSHCSFVCPSRGLQNLLCGPTEVVEANHGQRCQGVCLGVPSRKSPEFSQHGFFSWSHISLDCTKWLPPSDDNTGILTIIDRFSKMAPFVPLSKLPAADRLMLLVTIFQTSQHLQSLIGWTYQIQQWGGQG